MIAKCTCKHEQQDKIHGHGKRAHNPMKTPDKYRCTVCGDEKQVGKEMKK